MAMNMDMGHDHMGHQMMGDNSSMTTTMMMMGGHGGHTMPAGGDMNHGGHVMTGGEHGGHGNDTEHEMAMYFHLSNEAYILFEQLHVTTTGGMVGACFAIFFMAMLYEGLKVLREHLLRKASVKARYHSMPYNGNKSSEHIVEPHKAVGKRQSSIMAPMQSFCARIISCDHLIQTLLHVLQITISYFLMLVFMTYNGYLCIAIALGAGVGYFAFGWKRAIIVDINEHCH